MYNSFATVLHLVVNNATTIEKEEPSRPEVDSSIPKGKPGRKSKEKEHLAMVISELARNPNLLRSHFAKVYGLPYKTLRRWEAEGHCEFIKPMKKRFTRI